MKKIFTLAFLFVLGMSSAQEKAPTYKKSNDMVKATYYYEDGSIKEEGFFKDKKLAGKWISYNKKGEKTMIAHYDAGKKVGKWYAMNGGTIKEISYQDNAIVSVKTIEKKSMLAYNE